MKKSTTHRLKIPTHNEDQNTQRGVAKGYSLVQYTVYSKAIDLSIHIKSQSAICTQKQYPRLSNSATMPNGGETMKVFVKKIAFEGFVIDDKGRVRTPMFFDEAGLSEAGLSVLKSIAKYVLVNDESEIFGEKFTNIINQNKEHRMHKKLMAVAELQSKGYIELKT